MIKYIATFYSHYEALTFKKYLEGINITGTLISVPRSLSSSCGTCCQFFADSPTLEMKEKVEALYQAVCTDWVCVYGK